MDSSTYRADQANKNADNIKRQIAALQSQLSLVENQAESGRHVSPPRRKRDSPTALAPSTPSPRKKRKVESELEQQQQQSTVRRIPLQPPPKSLGRSAPAHPDPVEQHSAVLNRISSMNRDFKAEPSAPLQRSSGFADRAALLPTGDVERDDRLALVENLEPGPYAHCPSFNDPLFEEVEPNSGIRLSSRILPHEDIQEYLSGRFYLSPSRLYSAIRLLPDKQSYDVPVPGDWVTIAVVAERGPLKYTRAPVEVKREPGDENGKGKGRTRETSPPRPTGKKYVNIKLIDFGARSAKASSDKGAIRGDAFLSLLLFEADSFDLVTYEADEERGRKARAEKVYKGGSRGAFEAMSKVKEGDVIALMNPRILKPYKNSENPHPSSNILAVTPESAASIEVIGRAKDLGMCTVVKRDGKVCGSWTDKRVSDVCEYHVQTAVERRRSGRAEFSIGTSGMSRKAVASKKGKATDYDPRKKWGLAPAPEDRASAGATYVVSGHVVNPSSIHVGDTMGREAQAKAQRALAGNGDRELRALLERDKEGMRGVVKAREVAREMAERKREEKESKKKGKDARVKEKERRKAKEAESSANKEDVAPTKNCYSASMVKQLGFDPVAVKLGAQSKADKKMREKLDVLSKVQSSRKPGDMALGPRKGVPKVRSGVVVPAKKEEDAGEQMIDLDSDLE